MNQPFSRKDRIECNHKGQRVLGTVFSIRGDKVKMKIDGVPQTLTGPSSLFRHSNEPLPESERPKPCPFCKGDRMECDGDKGTVLLGVITSINGQRASMTLDGGRERISAGFSAFRPTAVPLPKDTIASEMDRYSVVKHKAFRGHGDCPAFNATICLDGRPLLSAFNSGHGGSNEYNLLARGPQRDALDAFYAAGKSWAIANGAPKLFESADLWIEWYVGQRPFGVLSVDYLREFAPVGA